tara:strand:+ start:310 stop:531 length:222 start_codon:yes stop_codon:yes gene_type:complete
MSNEEKLEALKDALDIYDAVWVGLSNRLKLAVVKHELAHLTVAIKENNNKLANIPCDLVLNAKLVKENDNETI